MATATQLPTCSGLDSTHSQRWQRPQRQQHELPHDSTSTTSPLVLDSHSTSSSHLISDNSSSDCSPTPISQSSHPRRRSSAFFEEGLKGEDAIVDARLRRHTRPSLRVRFRSKVDIHEAAAVDVLPQPFVASDEMPPFFPTLPRIMFLVLVLAVLIPSLGNSPFFKASVSPIGAKAGPVVAKLHDTPQLQSSVEKRQDSETDICKRWSGQSAVVNGTLYYYGGRKSTSADQTSDTWNNDFVSLDLTTSWQISTPSLTGLPRPSQVPAVSLGYLWNSYDTLYLYGGQFSDNPAESPSPFSVWQYDLASSEWSELDNTESSGGDNAEPSGEPIQRAAEGAGVTIPSLGRGFYFGGHLDGYTTEGWSQSIPRVYLTSLLEFTFPGYGNPAVNDGRAAGSGGLFRNITEGGVQGSAGFPERADGTLVYVPGYGDEGVLLGLAGGNNATFTQLNIIDVYDIATSSWYRQATSGPSPRVRVNPCAVTVSSADGSSTQMYMFGGQNLTPQGDQTQYDDMWILTIPSFTWIEVDMADQSVPPARAGHTCHVWNSQMIVFGGYVGQDLSCDSPGIYVFNTSSLAWQNEYQALASGEDDDRLNRQKSQDEDDAALQGSYGYAVPEKVQEIIGGNAIGSATVTEPAQTPTNGPLATGEARTYTVTGADGAVVTEVSPGVAADSSSGGSSGPNTGAIVAGVIAGVLAIIAAYLGWCAYIYRRQLKIYKNHVNMAQRQQLAGDGGRAFLAPASAGKWSKEKSQTSSSAPRPSDENSGRPNSGHNEFNPYRGTPLDGTNTARSSTEDLMHGQEPSFLGVVLNPRRSLRVVNRD